MVRERRVLRCFWSFNKFAKSVVEFRDFEDVRPKCFMISRISSFFTVRTISVRWSDLSIAEIFEALYTSDIVSYYQISWMKVLHVRIFRICMLQELSYILLTKSGCAISFWTAGKISNTRIYIEPALINDIKLGISTSGSLQHVSLGCVSVAFNGRIIGMLWAGQLASDTIGNSILRRYVYYNSMLPHGSSILKLKINQFQKC